MNLVKFSFVFVDELEVEFHWLEMSEEKKQDQSFFPQEKHDIFNGITIDLVNLDEKVTIEQFSTTLKGNKKIKKILTLN